MSDDVPPDLRRAADCCRSAKMGDPNPPLFFCEGGAPALQFVPLCLFPLLDCQQCVSGSGVGATRGRGYGQVAVATPPSRAGASAAAPLMPPRRHAAPSVGTIRAAGRRADTADPISSAARRCGCCGGARACGDYSLQKGTGWRRRVARRNSGHRWLPSHPAPCQRRWSGGAQKRRCPAFCRGGPLG